MFCTDLAPTDGDTWLEAVGNQLQGIIQVFLHPVCPPWIPGPDVLDPSLAAGLCGFPAHTPPQCMASLVGVSTDRWQQASLKVLDTQYPWWGTLTQSSHWTGISRIKPEPIPQLSSMLGSDAAVHKHLLA